MKRTYWIWSLIVMLLLVAGCAANDAVPTMPPAPTPLPPAQEPAAPPLTGAESDEADALVGQAVSDLQTRLGLRTDEVAVQQVTPAEFSDVSLGVPEPGMTYAQVVTAGYVIQLAAGGRTYEYRGSGDRVVAVPEAAAPPALAYQAVEVTGSGLTLEVPASWQRLEPEWAWSPEPAVRLGLNWMDLQPPAEPEAVLPEAQAQVLASEPLDLGWAQGRLITLEAYAPAPAGGNAQAAVQSVEMHALLVSDVGGTRRAFDLYLAAPDDKQLAALEGVLRHALESAVLAAAPQGDAAPAPAGDAQTSDWQVYSDPDYGFTIRYPADWAWKELQATGPGMPEDWPVTRILTFYPQAWEADLNRSGPPDPTAKPVVAPVSVEVCVGPLEQYQRVYVEPASSETIEINGLAVQVGVENPGPFQITRYTAQHPANAEVRVVVTDQMNGFPDRVAGNEAIAAQVPTILSTLSFH